MKGARCSSWLAAFSLAEARDGDQNVVEATGWGGAGEGEKLAASPFSARGRRSIGCATVLGVWVLDKFDPAGQGSVHVI